MTIFLDSHAGLGDSLALVIAVMTAIGLFIGLVVNAKRLGQETSTRNLQIVRDFFLDFINQDRLEPKMKTQADCITYVTGYLDLLDAIAYLNSRGKISDELIEVFYGHFSYGILLQNWYKKNTIGDAGKNFANLSKWLDKHKPPIEESKNELNLQLKEYSTLPEI